MKRIKEYKKLFKVEGPINLKELKKNIIFIKKNTNIPICVDTEGAQIRTKIIKKKKLKIKDNLNF